jgi:threonine aldolase
MEALAQANQGSATSYGEDPWTGELGKVVRTVFGAQARVFGALTGTGANVISLMAASQRWSGIVVSQWAHANTDENGAPERIGGLKLLPVTSPDAKIAADAVDRYCGDLGDVHRAQPTVLSITQSTELGTVYTVGELQTLIAAAHARGMHVHMDGSRLANAAASLGVGLQEITTDVGVDILSFGGTKNGAMLGEAVIVLAPQLADDVPFLRKMTMQLASKHRYISAQLLALFAADDGEPLWLTNARHSNAMATRLRAHIDTIDGVSATQETQANAVFAALPRVAADLVREQYRFYDWAPGPTPDTVEARWMCAWDTTASDVDAFAAAVAQAVARAS